MTKFGTILKLLEIKVALSVTNHWEDVGAAIVNLNEIIEALSEEFHSKDDTCPGFGPAYNDCASSGCPSHDRCHGCGQFHD